MAYTKTLGFLASIILHFCIARIVAGDINNFIFLRLGTQAFVRICDLLYVTSLSGQIR